MRRCGFVDNAVVCKLGCLLRMVQDALFSTRRRTLVRREGEKRANCHVQWDSISNYSCFFITPKSSVNPVKTATAIVLCRYQKTENTSAIFYAEVSRFLLYLFIRFNCFKSFHDFNIRLFGEQTDNHDCDATHDEGRKQFINAQCKNTQLFRSR